MRCLLHFYNTFPVILVLATFYVAVRRARLKRREFFSEVGPLVVVLPQRFPTGTEDRYIYRGNPVGRGHETVFDCLARNGNACLSALFSRGQLERSLKVVQSWDKSFPS